MRLVLFFFAFTITLCNADPTVCQYYEDEKNMLQINCYQDKQICPYDDVPSLNSSNELNLKIEGCEQHFISTTLAQYPYIKRLDVSDSKLRILDWKNAIFPNLIDFDASGNELTFIPTTMLSRFPKLKTLRLNKNHIEEISAGDFRNVGKELNFLDLSENRLKSIDENAFDSLRNLGEINLSNNELATYPVAASKKGVIRSVDLSENPQLTTFDCAFIAAAMRAKNVSLTWKYVTVFDGLCDNVKFVMKHGGYDQINNYDNYTELICDNSNQNKCFENVQYFVAGPGSFQNVNVLRLLGLSALKIYLHRNNLKGIDVDRKKFPALKELNVYRNLNSTHVDELRSEYKHADIIDAASTGSNKVWWILLSILGILAIAIFIILCCLWIMPKICRSD